MTCHHIPRLTVGLGATIVLAGCTTPSGLQLNPTRMHVVSKSVYLSSATQTDPSVNLAEVTSAEALPAKRYFEAQRAALKDAETGGQDPVKLDAYVDAGIAVTQAYCLRWFQRLSDQNMVKEYADGNVNVLRQLGTALLGIGKASSALVTSYGAANTAWEGASKNFEDSFFFAPTSRKVKLQVMGLLDAESDKLTGKDTKPATFNQAYQRLERYADLCTHATAREIINSALDQGRAEVKNNKVTVTPTAADTEQAVKQGTAAAEKDKASALAQRDQARGALVDLQQELKTQMSLQRELSGLKAQLRNTQEALEAERLRARPKVPESPPQPAASAPG